MGADSGERADGAVRAGPTGPVIGPAVFCSQGGATNDWTVQAN